MNKIIVLFPIDLYDDIKYLQDKKVFIVEEQIYFDRYSNNLNEFGKLKFNIIKPIYHRATMQAYYDRIVQLHKQITYVGLNENWDKLFWNFLDLHKNKIKKIPRLSVLIKHIKNHSKKILANDYDCSGYLNINSSYIDNN